MVSWACITKLITAVIYCFHNKLEWSTLNTRLGWKGLPGTNTLDYYGNRQLSFMIQAPQANVMKICS